MKNKNAVALGRRGAKPNMPSTPRKSVRPSWETPHAQEAEARLQNYPMGKNTLECPDEKAGLCCRRRKLVTGTIPDLPLDLFE
jgi:hypothetical protein